MRAPQLYLFKFQGEKLEGKGGIEWRVKVRVEPQVSAAGMNERRMAVTVWPACVCSIEHLILSHGDHTQSQSCLF